MAGVKLIALMMWTPKVYAAVHEKVMGSPLLFEVVMIREGTVLRDTISTIDDFSLSTWLSFTNGAYLSKRPTLFILLPRGGV